MANRSSLNDRKQDNINQRTPDRALASNHQDHALTGNLADHRECHITPDWLLIYKRNDSALLLVLMRTGSHSQLFSK